MEGDATQEALLERFHFVFFDFLKNSLLEIRKNRNIKLHFVKKKM